MKSYHPSRPIPKTGVRTVIQAGNIQFTRRRDFEVWCLLDNKVEDGKTLVEAAQWKLERKFAWRRQEKLMYTKVNYPTSSPGDRV